MYYLCSKNQEKKKKEKIMEDYKQKYEETIERVKEMYLSQPDNCEFTAPFEKAFPEAKESTTPKLKT